MVPVIQKWGLEFVKRTKDNRQQTTDKNFHSHFAALFWGAQSHSKLKKVSQRN